MTMQIRYYAIVDDFSSRENPVGVLRRIKHEAGQRDEAFGRDLQWSNTSLLYSAERGNLDNRFFEISAEEAERIVERIRATVTGGGDTDRLFACEPAWMWGRRRPPDLAAPRREP